MLKDLNRNYRYFTMKSWFLIGGYKIQDRPAGQLTQKFRKQNDKLDSIHLMQSWYQLQMYQ